MAGFGRDYRGLVREWGAGSTHVRAMRGVGVQNTDGYQDPGSSPAIIWSTTGIYLQSEVGIVATHDSRIRYYHPTLSSYKHRVDPISYCCRSMMQSTHVANVPNACPYRNFQSLSLIFWMIAQLICKSQLQYCNNGHRSRQPRNASPSDPPQPLLPQCRPSR